MHYSHRCAAMDPGWAELNFDGLDSSNTPSSSSAAAAAVGHRKSVGSAPPVTGTSASGPPSYRLSHSALPYSVSFIFFTTALTDCVSVPSAHSRQWGIAGCRPKTLEQFAGRHHVFCIPLYLLPHLKLFCLVFRFPIWSCNCFSLVCNMWHSSGPRSSHCYLGHYNELLLYYVELHASQDVNASAETSLRLSHLCVTTGVHICPVYGITHQHDLT